MPTVIKTKKGVHIFTDSNFNEIKADAFVGVGEYNSLKDALNSNPSSIVIGKYIEENLTINKELTITQVVDSLFLTVEINTFCILDSLTIKNLIIKAPCIIINSTITDNIIIEQADGFILLKNNLINQIDISNIGNYDLSLHIENNEIKKQININQISKQNKNIIIYIHKNTLHQDIFINNQDNNLSDCCITISQNNVLTKKDYFVSAKEPNIIYVKDNYYMTDNQKIFLQNDLYIKYTGYSKELVNANITDTTKTPFIKKEEVTLKKYIKLPVKNIPQYVSNINDPALNVGCEATATAIALSYILNKSITKNQMASCMIQKDANKETFWNSFIGNIYDDGWGCMSPVSVKAINNYLKQHNLENTYEVINTTNTPLYILLKYLEQNIPIIVWCTMGNNQEMFHMKYGSTIFEINNQPLYWPGRDHSLVIVGYNLNKQEIYLADPEVNSEELRVRNIFEFENRFAELYSQSIIIIKK